jgi:eukaryotic-like serine/threonine-protein kinase
MTPTTAIAPTPPRPRVSAPERYEVLETLGQGAMGVVYKARDRELDRVVALKTIQRQPGADFEAIAGRLAQEARTAARLSHPGIVTVYDVGRHAGTPYVVMEYFTGRTLTELLEAGPLPPDRAVHVALQVCRALAYAHAQGVVHRDVKSSNIMLDDGWHAKLADFGVAHVVDKPANERGMMIGTPAYMAPEQASGGTPEARSDLFAVGVVLYEALTGVKPFPGDDVAQVLHDVVHVDPMPPREKNFAVPPALDAVVRRAMSKDPSDRYPDAAAFAEALIQTGTFVEPFAVERWLGHARRRPTILVASLLIVIGVAVGVYVRGRVAEPPPPPVVTAEPVAAAAEAEPEVPLRPRERALARSTAPALATHAEAPAAPVPAPAPVAEPAPAMPAGKPGCLSVNAVPFATVYVDGREMGDTPQACLRVPAGRHRVHFQWSDKRSPERVVEVRSEHTADNALRVSYDFRAGRYLTNAD